MIFAGINNFIGLRIIQAALIGLILPGVTQFEEIGSKSWDFAKRDVDLPPPGA